MRKERKRNAYIIEITNALVLSTYQLKKKSGYTLSVEYFIKKPKL
ncbi:hypothetical protein [Bacillus cereus]|uniref:Uncharacterized protein n=1 Tax=Bacillus cereus TaxID=1396 RepID=A0A164K8S7_BACCE|nr:hypothetical protein [Bacillus cereus]KZD48695.1 hypothetical protein B4088_6623 [Bacillus cereus]